MSIPSTSRLRLVAAPATPETRHPAPVDPRDIGQLFRAYAPYVARVAMRIMGNSHEVDDLVQDVFLDAQRGIAKLRDPKAVKGWLAQIAVRNARRRLKKRAFMRTLGLDRPADFDGALDPTAAGDRSELLSVYRILDGLPSETRIAWVMNKVEGESLDTVGELCDCSRATAHRRIQRAQKALEEGLNDG